MFSCLETVLTVGRTWGGGGLMSSRRKVFQHFENTIYSTKLKVSVAVHSSIAEILIRQSCIHDI